MHHKWHVRKGYLKIHIAVDIKKKRILSLEVTSEEVHDGKMLKKLVDNASENIIPSSGLDGLECVQADLNLGAPGDYRHSTLARSHVIYLLLRVKAPNRKGPGDTRTNYPARCAV